MKTRHHKHASIVPCDKTVTTDVAAARLNLPSATVRTYLSRGILHGKKVGRTVLIFAKSVESYGKSRKKPGRPKSS